MHGVFAAHAIVAVACTAALPGTPLTTKTIDLRLPAIRRVDPRRVLRRARRHVGPVDDA
jgi:hypothetical protein